MKREKTTKKKVYCYAEGELVDMAKREGVNISGVLSEALRAKVSEYLLEYKNPDDGDYTLEHEEFKAMTELSAIENARQISSGHRYDSGAFDFTLYRVGSRGAKQVIWESDETVRWY
jgi:post-segregation antitoxin (ccd killing protein)